jgi:ATP-dependent Clp protease protease subunit
MASLKSKDDLDKILSSGVDLKTRRIYFGNLSDGDEGSEFTWATVEATIRKIQALADNSQKPIELHMCSPGGDTAEMLRLYDAIQECKCQIKFYGSGQICSSAAYIMSGCDERYLSKNTSIMLHETQFSVPFSSHTDSAISQEESEKLRKILVQTLSDNSRMSKEWWSVMLTRDIYFNPDEAIAIGIADKIVDYKKRGNLRRMRIAHLNKKIDEESFANMISDMNKRIKLPGKMTVKIEIPKEKSDKEVYVDESPLEEVNNHHNEEQQSQDP